MLCGRFDAILQVFACRFVLASGAANFVGSLAVSVNDAFDHPDHGGLSGVGAEKVYRAFVAEGGSWRPQPLFGR